MRVKLAAIQMVSGPEVGPNLERAAGLIEQAARSGAKLVGLPENFYLMGRREEEKVKAAEDDGDGPIQRFLSQAAREHRVWLVGGTAPIRCADPARIRSACLVYDDAGRRAARYDKMHLFRFETALERYDEGRGIEAGNAAVAVDTPFARIALSVCYDVRFAELYRVLGTFDIAFVPSAFTAPTGRAHWHVLLRARAVENLAYVVAPAQGGTHANGRRTYGHSLIVDPWGEVLAERAEGEGVVFAEFDTERLRQVRTILPALEHRRLLATNRMETR